MVWSAEVTNSQLAMTTNRPRPAIVIDRATARSCRSLLLAAAAASTCGAISFWLNCSCGTKMCTAPHHGRIVGTIGEQLQATARCSTGCTNHPTLNLTPLTAQVAATNWRSAVGERRSHAVPADCLPIVCLHQC